MRKHPLLAFFTATTTVALATSGALVQSAFASRTPHAHRTRAHAGAHLDLQALTVTDTPASRATAPETRLSGAMALSFAVTGGPVLGSYVPPAVRRRELAARQRAIEARHRAVEARHALARRRAHLAALRRQEAAARQRAYAPATGVWAELRACESGGNYAENTGNGFYGAYQFLPSTWWSIGFSGMPNQAPPAVQDRAAQLLQARSGWGAWPSCSQMLGL